MKLYYLEKLIENRTNEVMGVMVASYRQRIAKYVQVIRYAQLPGRERIRISTAGGRLSHVPGGRLSHAPALAEDDIKTLAGEAFQRLQDIQNVPLD